MHSAAAPTNSPPSRVVRGLPDQPVVALWAAALAYSLGGGRRRRPRADTQPGDGPSARTGAAGARVARSVGRWLAPIGPPCPRWAHGSAGHMDSDDLQSWAWWDWTSWAWRRDWTSGYCQRAVAARWEGCSSASRQGTVDWARSWALAWRRTTQQRGRSRTFATCGLVNMTENFSDLALCWQRALISADLQLFSRT